jgi:hypothetical protein
MRIIGNLAAASEAGYRIGRGRSRPSADDLVRFGSNRLRASLRRGIQRGLASAARYEQLGLALDMGIAECRCRRCRMPQR